MWEMIGDWPDGHLGLLDRTRKSEVLPGRVKNIDSAALRLRCGPMEAEGGAYLIQTGS